MSRAFVIAFRELRSYLQDRTELVFSLLLPVAIFALMYGAFSGQSLFNGTAYIVNDDAGGHSQHLIQRLEAKEGLEVRLLTLQEANEKLENSDVLLFAHIPEDFSVRLDSGWGVTITFRQRGNGGMEGQIVASLVRGEADAMSQELQAERQVQRSLVTSGIGGDEAEATVQRLLDRERDLPFIQVEETTVGGDVSLVHQFMPGIISMFVLFSVTLGSRALVEERRKGTMERLLTTRLTVGQLYAGKFLAGTARGTTQTLILLGLAAAVFRLFTPLSFLMTMLVALIFAAAASTLGLLIASVSRTEDQAISLSVLFTMSTVMLGGTFFEIPQDSVLGTIGKASINTYVNSALKTMTTAGSTLADAMPEMLVLTATAVIGLVAGRALFRVMPGGR